MKYLGVAIAVSLTLLLLAMVGIFSFLPPPEADQPTNPQIINIEPAVEAPLNSVMTQATMDPKQAEMILAEREAAYQGQIIQLDQALQERQTTYQEQLQLLSSQVSQAQTQLDEFEVQEQLLLAQIAELEATRAERLALYQGQLEQARAQYNILFADMQAQMDEIRVKMAEAQAQLGR